MKLNYDMALILQNYNDQYKCSFIDGLESQHCINGACMRFKGQEQCICKDVFWGPNCNYDRYDMASTGLNKNGDENEVGDSQDLMVKYQNSFFVNLQQFWVTTICVFSLIALMMFCIGLLFGKRSTTPRLFRRQSNIGLPTPLQNALKTRSMSHSRESGSVKRESVKDNNLIQNLIPKNKVVSKLSQ